MWIKFLNENILKILNLEASPRWKDDTIFRIFLTFDTKNISASLDLNIC